MSDDTPDAFEAAKDAATGVIGTVTYDGTEYAIIKRPNALLLAELSRLDSDDPDAMATLVDFFMETLGKPTYKKFRSAFFSQEFESVEASVEALAEVVKDVVEASMGRPTEPSKN